MTCVSVYLPTHNRQKLLERALRSVIQQTHRDLEILVVNDGSSDQTRNFLDQVAPADPRVIVFHLDAPMGAAAARNVALRSARGEYVTGLDDDDEFKPHRVESLLAEWKVIVPTHDRVSCLFTESVVTDGVRTSVTTDRKSEVSYRDLFIHNFIGNQIFCPTGRLLDVGGFDETLPALEDLELFMRLVKRFGVACRLQDSSYICHVDGGRHRISTDADRQRLAFEKIAAKTSDQPSEWHSELFLQLFSPFYGTTPSLSDWQRMLRLRPPPHVIARMLRATVRNSVRKLV